jgi:hypothetical protein
VKSLALSLLLLSSVAYADPDTILRKGFTLRVGFGGGGAYFAPEQAPTSQEPGIAVDFLVGGFVRPNLAIVYHQVLVDSQPFEDVFTPGVSAAGTLAAQYWIGDRVNFLGGLGLGIMQHEARNLLRSDVETGLAIDLGVSFVPLVSPHHALSLSLAVAPVVTDHLISNLYGASMTWQYY